MRTRLLLLFAVIAAFLLAATPASGVQYGEPDTTNEYPYVGLVVFYEDGQVLWRCSGALISPTVFLTAAHCTGEDPESGAEPDLARIWFDVGPIIPDPNYTGTCTKEVTGYPCGGFDAEGTPVEHPDWSGYLTIPNTSDVGVVLLKKPYQLDEYGQLAPVGYLDQLATQRGIQDVTFTVVGYGLQLVKPRQSAERTRMIGTVHLINLSSALTDGWNLHYSSNPGQGHGGSGGTCFGDSGGPVIYDDPVLGEIIVGVNSFVLNLNCKGSAFAYRVDTAYAQSFINNASRYVNQ